MPTLPARSKLTPRALVATARRRVRPHLVAVVQTAVAAVAAWLLAVALLPADRPAFASIAAIIVLGAAYGRRRRNAVELLGRRRRSDPLASLSGRELDVLALMAEGRSNGAIAERLVVTEGAVEKHISSIFAKLSLPAAPTDHRRVLAVLTFLRA